MVILLGWCAMRYLLGVLLTLWVVPASAQSYDRIVVAGGDLTEMVIALGEKDRLVGVDSTSLYPPDVTELPQIGYVRRLTPEGLLTLEPDLLIGAHDVGPAIAVDQLRAAGVEVALAPEGDGAEAVVDKFTFVSEILGRQAEAAALIEAYRGEMDRIAAAIATLKTEPKVLFILSVRDGAPIVGGAGTAADSVIKLAGGRNVAVAVNGWKDMNQEAIIAAAPDVLLVMSSHLEGMGGFETLLARPEIALTPAGRAGRTVEMDGSLLLQFGPRTPEGVRQLAEHLHVGLVFKR